MQTTNGKEMRAALAEAHALKTIQDACLVYHRWLDKLARTPEAEAKLQIGSYFGDGFKFLRLADAISSLID